MMGVCPHLGWVLENLAEVGIVGGQIYRDLQSKYKESKLTWHPSCQTWSLPTSYRRQQELRLFT